MSAQLINELKNYVPFDADEVISHKKLCDFLHLNTNCFSRTNQVGHITAGGLVYNKEGKVLLNHHIKSGMWIQFGGHCDGNPNPLETAFREVFEESGITELTLVSNEIFDIGDYTIQARANEPQHTHYDINYLFYDNSNTFAVSDESIELKWCTINEALKLVDPTDKGMNRMLKKLSSII